MYTAIAANKRNSFILTTIFLVVLAGLSWILGAMYEEPNIFYLAMFVASIYTLVQYFAAPKLALAVNGAKEVTKRDAPQLYRTVENISIATGMPMPKVYLIDDPAPNAFATGRDPQHAIVAATTGLVDMMTKPELEAVIAHEMAHIKNLDIRFMMIVFSMVSAIALISDLLMRIMWSADDRRENSSPIFMALGIVAAIVSPIVAMLVQFAVSRQREYLADSTGILATRYPDGLISALEKIQESGSVLQRQNTATAHLFFANPLKPAIVAKLFSTHPPIKDRIARLRAMGDKL